MEEIINKIYQTYGKENIRNLRIEWNDNSEEEYTVWFDVLDDDYWSKHIHYINKNKIDLFDFF